MQPSKSRILERPACDLLTAAERAAPELGGLKQPRPCLFTAPGASCLGSAGWLSGCCCPESPAVTGQLRWCWNVSDGLVRGWRLVLTQWAARLQPQLRRASSLVSRGGWGRQALKHTHLYAPVPFKNAPLARASHGQAQRRWAGWNEAWTQEGMDTGLWPCPS